MDLISTRRRSAAQVQGGRAFDLEFKILDYENDLTEWVAADN